LKDLESKLVAENYKLSSVKSEIETAENAKSEIAEFTSMLSSKRNELAVITSELKAIESKKELLIPENATLEVKNKSLLQERDSLVPEIAKIKTEISESQKNLDLIIRKETTLKATLGEMDKKLAELKLETEISTSKNNSLAKQIKDSEVRKTKILEEIAESRKTLVSARNQVSLFEQEFIKSQESLREVDATTQKLIIRSRSLTEEIKILQSEKVKLSREISDLEIKQKNINN
jgi:chromosome segregation ATPase